MVKTLRIIGFLVGIVVVQTAFVSAMQDGAEAAADAATVLMTERGAEWPASCFGVNSEREVELRALWDHARSEVGSEYENGYSVSCAWEFFVSKHNPRHEYHEWKTMKEQCFILSLVWEELAGKMRAAGRYEAILAKLKIQEDPAGPTADPFARYIAPFLTDFVWRACNETRLDYRIEFTQFVAHFLSATEVIRGELAPSSWCVML